MFEYGCIVDGGAGSIRRCDGDRAVGGKAPPQRGVCDKRGERAERKTHDIECGSRSSKAAGRCVTAVGEPQHGGKLRCDGIHRVRFAVIILAFLPSTRYRDCRQGVTRMPRHLAASIAASHHRVCGEIWR